MFIDIFFITIDDTVLRYKTLANIKANLLKCCLNMSQYIRVLKFIITQKLYSVDIRRKKKIIKHKCVNF